MRESHDTAVFLSQLSAIVGEAHVLTQGDLSAWTVDWRRRYQGRPLAVVRPASTAEVAAVVRACVAQRVAIVPQGGNTGLVGGGVPDRSGKQILLNLSRLHRVRMIDRANLTLTAEAGCVLKVIQDAAAAEQLLFPLSLASEGSCTIGGNLATNAGGTQVLRYGNARDLCLGLEVVTAGGHIWSHLSGLRKDNTGYDLRQWFIGSEGTLGIITAATLKLFPQPVARCTAVAACPSIDAAVSLLQTAQARLGASLTGFELMGQFALSLVALHFPTLPQMLPPSPWSVLLELSDSESEDHARTQLESTLAHALEQGCIVDAVVAQSLRQSLDFWRWRESIPLAQAEEGLNIKHDIALPVSAIPAFVREMAATLEREAPGVRLVTFGHLGDGNLHYNVQAPLGVDVASFLTLREPDINRRVYDTVLSLGGSISAEHGIGELKRDELYRVKPPEALALMHAVKAALDPLNLLNPGRMLASPSTHPDPIGSLSGWSP